MAIEYPTIKFNIVGARRRAILYEDYVSLEGSSFVGVSEDLGQAYYDEICYVFRYKKTDWPFLGLALLMAFLGLFGLIFAFMDDSTAKLVGVFWLAISFSLMMYFFYRLVFVKSLIIRVLSPRGSLEFRGDRPRSSDPKKDARKFFDLMLSKLEIVPAMQAESPRPQATANRPQTEPRTQTTEDRPHTEHRPQTTEDKPQAPPPPPSTPGTL